MLSIVHGCNEKKGDWEAMVVKGSELLISLCDIEMRFVRVLLSTAVLLVGW